MKNILTENQSLEAFLPEYLNFIDANGSRLYTKDKRVFFNYFNDSIRFLCGYDNQVLNQIIDNEVNVLRTNPEEIYELNEQVSDTLRINAGNKYKDVFFTAENTYFSIAENLIKGDDQFIINTTSNTNIPKSLYNSIVELDSLLKVEEEFKKDNYTFEGWSVKKIKKIFSKYKKRIAGLIINPVLLNRGIFLDDNTCSLLVGLCKRYRIPIIWDESLSCFFRSSTFYLLNQYKIEPEFVVINSTVSENNRTHIIILKKNMRKNWKCETLSPERNKIALILIHSILYYIAQHNLKDRIDRISIRLTRKLEALSKNIAERFHVESRGLIVFIEFQNEKILDRFRTFSSKERIIVLNNRFNAVFLDPQITISTRSVDTFIQVMDNFFKIGFKLPNS